LINELMLLLYLASGLTAVKLLTSLSATACIGPGALCAQGLTRSLTCSVIFRLFQQAHVFCVVLQHTPAVFGAGFED